MRRHAAVWLVVAAVALAGALLGWGIGWIVNELEQLRDDNRTLYAQLESHNIEPDVDAPPGEPGSPGEQGPEGEKGERGEPGRDAKPLTDEQIAVAFRAFMADRPLARGPAGEDGQDGADGAPGPQGPAGTQGPAGPSCPTGYTLQPDTLRGDDVLICKRTGAAL